MAHSPKINKRDTPRSDPVSDRSSTPKVLTQAPSDQRPHMSTVSAQSGPDRDAPASHWSSPTHSDGHRFPDPIGRFMPGDSTIQPHVAQELVEPSMPLCPTLMLPMYDARFTVALG